MSPNKISSPLRLRVKAFAGPHVRVTMSDCWKFFIDAGLVDNGGFTYYWLYNFTNTNPDFDFAFKPSSHWGKRILKSSLHTILDTLGRFIHNHSQFSLASITLRRIRPLLSPKHLAFLRRFHTPLPTIPPTPSLKNLIRKRLKSPKIFISTPPPISTLPHQHKTSFTPISHFHSIPLNLRPIKTLLFGLSLPRRYPREGVG